MLDPRLLDTERGRDAEALALVVAWPPRTKTDEAAFSMDLTAWRAGNWVSEI